MPSDPRPPPRSSGCSPRRSRPGGPRPSRAILHGLVDVRRSGARRTVQPGSGPLVFHARHDGCGWAGKLRALSRRTRPRSRRIILPSTPTSLRPRYQRKRPADVVGPQGAVRRTRRPCGPLVQESSLPGLCPRPGRGGARVAAARSTRQQRPRATRKHGPRPGRRTGRP